MMRKLIATLLPALFLTSAFVCAQTTDSVPAKPPAELTIDLGVVQQQILSHHFIGVNYAMKGYATPRWAVGMYLSTAQKKLPDTFHYTIGKPVVSYSEFGLTTGYDVLQTPHWRININITNGVSIARLGDDDDKVKHYGTHGKYYLSKKIATNTYYLLEPGVDVSYRIVFCHHSPDIYLTAKSSYRVLIGGSHYGSANDFSSSLFGIGFSFIGYARDDKKTEKAEKTTAML